jgi:hypothetical protein
MEACEFCKFDVSVRLGLPALIMVNSMNESGQSLLEKYLANPNHCRNCDEVLPYRKRKNQFCNNKCAASTNNKGVKRNFKKKKENKCLFCLNGTGNLKFCSTNCFMNFNWNKTKTQIEISGKANFVRTAKRYLAETVGNKCNICGITEWQGKKIVLILDHINGNSGDCGLNNLRLLCPNCDSQTLTYKGRNVGNGRFSRRLRYKEGKSF